MTATPTGHESMTTVMSAALEPYRWRRFTPELVARYALAAHDRHGLHGALVALGAAVGDWERLEPAGRDDVRVGGLVELLVPLRWTELRLPILCRHLSGLLGP